MFDPVSRAQPRLNELITRRKVARPTKDRASQGSAGVMSKEQQEELEAIEADLIFYSKQRGGEAGLSKFLPRGQYLDTYA